MIQCHCGELRVPAECKACGEGVDAPAGKRWEAAHWTHPNGFFEPAVWVEGQWVDK